MPGGVAEAVLLGAVQRRIGMPRAGAISTALLTTGVSLLMVRGRRPMGLALIAAGGTLRWAEIEREKAAKGRVSPSAARPDGGASPARGLR